MRVFARTSFLWLVLLVEGCHSSGGTGDSGPSQAETPYYTSAKSCMILSNLFEAGSTLSDLQQEEVWNRGTENTGPVQGRIFDWDLEVTAVNRTMDGTGYFVQARCPEAPKDQGLLATGQVFLTYDASAEPFVLQLGIGKIHKLKGKLTSRPSIGGLYGLSADGLL